MSEVAGTVIALVATVAAFVLGAGHMAGQAGEVRGVGVMEAMLALSLYAGLTYGSVVYLLARFGHQRRQRGFRAHGPRAEDLHKWERVPTVCVLIPSYKEELRVIRQTVVSAALAEYPSRRIVVLIDDPSTGSPAEVAGAESARRLVADLDRRFREAAQPFRAELSAFVQRSQRDIDAPSEARRLACLLKTLAAWIDELAEPVCDAAFAHVDRFFNEEIVRTAARSHRLRADALQAAEPTPAQILAEYRRLASLLDVEIGSFERKRYANLSHAPSKAMNLNSYIGLLGRNFKVVGGPAGHTLLQCEPSDADFSVSHADLLLTLDADSLVRHDYLLKLVAIMADDRIGVAQTPYSTHPGAPKPLERTAGAQTDLQYLVHQGFTYFGATYWVGANALLRFQALQDIRQTATERGFEVPVFIQDKTVIEDTGSTLDLVRHGWTLHNHPERLAFSATPPDFGALIIQRRRWANGGLIILADLLRYMLCPAGSRPGFHELVIRAHYLLSPTLSSLGVLLLALLPMDAALASPWLVLGCLPYLLVYARDLRMCGYGWRDFFRIYALNLMLIPVNAAGVLHSLQQILLRRKCAFARTPKVGNRTASPALHVAIQLSLPLVGVAAMTVAAADGQVALACFACFNTVCVAYGFDRFIGLRDAWHDLRVSVPTRRLLAVGGRYRATRQREIAG